LNRNTLYALVGVLVVVVVVLVLLPFGKGNAVTGTEPCVPQDAWTETIEHPAVTHVVHHDAVTKDIKVADQRYAWTPKGPVDESQDGPAAGSTPLTDPDHWQANTSNYNGTDPLDEVFQEGRGNGGNNASWFYWTSKTETVVVTPAYDETVVDHEAYTETIEHPAVTCPETPTDNPTTPTETPTVPSETPTVNVPEETPVTNVPTPEVVEDDPVVHIETTSEPTRTIKKFTHESGKITREVINYGNDVKEEGL